ncbi:MAG TPA: hypothetical protein VNQ55_06320, partial [Parapedobacter sp.]|nr:hypothetical protein [Parapedobacter sp.]
MIKKIALCGISAAALAASPSYAQDTSNTLATLYEQASETSGLVVQYDNDVRAVDYFYGPMSSGGYGRWGAQTLNSPEQRARLLQLDKDYLNKLAGLDFGGMSIHGQVDYVLLKRNIEAQIEQLEAEGEHYQ